MYGRDVCNVMQYNKMQSNGMHVWMDVCMDGWMYVCLYVWMYDYVCMHACMHVFQMLCDESSLDSSSSSASGIACLSSSSSRRAPEQDISEELHTHTQQNTPAASK